MFPHLLVAIDSHLGARHATAFGFRIASCIGARVTVLFVVTPVEDRASYSLQARSQGAIDAGERLFRHARQMAGAVGVPCVCRYAFGRDVRMIVREAARAHRCDLILFNAREAAAPAIDAATRG